MQAGRPRRVSLPLGWRASSERCPSLFTCCVSPRRSFTRQGFRLFLYKMKVLRSLESKEDGKNQTIDLKIWRSLPILYPLGPVSFSVLPKQSKLYDAAGKSVSPGFLPFLNSICIADWHSMFIQRAPSRGLNCLFLSCDLLLTFPELPSVELFLRLRQISPPKNGPTDSNSGTNLQNHQNHHSSGSGTVLSASCAYSLLKFGKNPE